ncbi:hypothetical protein EYF80_006730 [Liparis tanakae]|uniref:Uncharacterized protein n=1 Tax=Liparis tanakae TaxID=230148 RepID=A0A4Z2J0Z1_9TELE|nr:hypothetical protein EYF80_006730 [Liparis tanakae]
MDWMRVYHFPSAEWRIQERCEGKLKIAYQRAGHFSRAACFGSLTVAGKKLLRKRVLWVMLLLALLCLKLYTSPNCPAPSLLSSFRLSREISHSSCHQGFCGALD